MIVNKRRWLLHLLGLAGLLALVSGGASARADHLDRQLLDEVPKLVRYLEKHHYHSVAILPFRVGTGKRSPRFNVGELNANMAARLETGLTLATEHKSIKVIHKAATTAARSGQRSLATPKKRSALFTVNYHLPYGNERVRPDVILTGDVRFDANNKSALVAIKAFDKRGGEPAIVDQFRVKTDRIILADSGKSFRVKKRGANHRDAEDDELAAQDATDQENKGPDTGDTSSNPGNSGNGTGDDQQQVKLTVLYDGNPVQLDSGSRGVRRARLVKRRGGAATITPPDQQNKVVLKLENTSTSEQLAVVLRVNGKNTLYGGTDDPVNAPKWVLDPGAKYEIKGFYTDANDDKNVRPFKVLSAEESKQKEQDFSADQLGLIEVHVFKKGTDGGDETRKISLRGLSPRGIKRAHPKTKADYLRELKKKTGVHAAGERLVHAKSKSGSRVHRDKKGRGIIVEGELEAGGKLEKVSFDNPSLMFSQAIRYYTPGGDSSTSSSNASGPDGD